MKLNWNDLLTRSHSPYSNLSQAVVVVSADDVLFPGVRVENASFPLTIFASQAALFSCFSENKTPKAFWVQNLMQLDEKIHYLANFHNIPIYEKENIPIDVQWYQPEKFDSSDDTKNQLKNLLPIAITTESDFQVSCLLVSVENQVISGVNIEYPDWQIGLCAERVAISKAISNGITRYQKISITASKGGFISPCGACRQVLVEHMPYDIISLYHPDGTRSTTSAADLLPAFFNGSTLNKKV